MSSLNTCSIVSSRFMERHGLVAFLEALGLTVLDVFDSDVDYARGTVGPVALLLVDKLFAPVVLAQKPQARVLVIVDGIDERQSVSLVQQGAHGIVLRTDTENTWVAATEAVLRGANWWPFAHVPDRSKLATLTRRQEQMAELAAGGLTNDQISQALGIASGTVKIHLRNAFRKLGIHSRHSLTLAKLKAVA